MKEQLIEAFKDLKFNEKNHTYFAEDKKLIPTSNVIKRFYNEFDTYGISHRLSRGNKRKQKQLIDSWKRKSDKAKIDGTRIHKYAEDVGEGKLRPPICGRERAVIRWFDDLPDYYVILAQELRMYSKIYAYAGTTDKVMLDTRYNELVIGDYKTNQEDLFKIYNYQDMLEPFDFLADCAYNHYQLQLSLYQILLEERGFTVRERLLIHLKEDTYQLYRTNNFTDLLRNELC